MRAPSAGCGAGTRPGCDGCRCRCCAWPAAAAPRRGRRPRPRATSGARSAAIATDSASFGSFLSDRPGAEHPDPRRQRRRHVEDGLTRGDELLGQQVAETAGGLDRPRSRRRAARPTRSSCGTCLRVARTLARASSASLRSIATAVCVALCGSTPMITAMSTSVDSTGWEPRGHSCFRSSVHVPLSSHPRRGPRREALRSKANRSTTGGRHFVSHPVRDLETLRTSRRVHPKSQAGT